MIKVEIAGYTFNGDKYCADCIAAMVRQVLWNWTTHVGVLSEHPEFHTWDAETLLQLWANAENVDREYADSEDFPVPFSGQTAKTNQSWADHEQTGVLRCQCGNDFLGEF